MAYSDKLKDPRWQRCRLKILERDEFQCQKCYNNTETLHVHHRYYLPKCEPWDYPDVLLVTLCETCHTEEESIKSLANKEIYEAFLKIGLLNDDIRQLAEIISSLENVVYFPPYQSTIHFALTDKYIWDFIKKMHDYSILKSKDLERFKEFDF